MLLRRARAAAPDVPLAVRMRIRSGLGLDGLSLDGLPLDGRDGRDGRHASVAAVAVSVSDLRRWGASIIGGGGGETHGQISALRHELLL